MTSNDILNLIKEIIEKTGAESVSINLEEGNSLGKANALWFSVEVSNPYVFLGRGGEALYALNHLVKKVVENKTKGTP